MAKKKKYYSSANYNPGVFTFGNAGMPQEAFRKAFPDKPGWYNETYDDSINQINYQIMQDMKPLRKGKIRSKY